MSPVALHMKLVSSQLTSRVAQHRLNGIPASRAAIQQAPRHVMRATKLEELENSVKDEKKMKKSKHEDEDDEEFDGDEGLSPQQVEAFLNVLCDETDIAEVQLKMGGFKMKVRRSLKGGAAAAAAPVTIAAPIPAGLPAAAPVAAAASISSVSDIDSDVEEDDGSTIAIVAPKVGLMRRGRYLKGKQVGKGPVVEIGATIKKGQVLCYIEQLGTFWPVESPQAGEIAGFVVEEGEPVEYGQEVIDILPFFGGHIIGDSKYA